MCKWIYAVPHESTYRVSPNPEKRMIKVQVNIALEGKMHSRKKITWEKIQTQNLNNIFLSLSTKETQNNVSTDIIFPPLWYYIDALKLIICNIKFYVFGSHFHQWTGKYITHCFVFLALKLTFEKLYTYGSHMFVQLWGC